MTLFLVMLAVGVGIIIGVLFYATYHERKVRKWK